MPSEMVKDSRIFPERDEPGLMLIEAKDKETLESLEEIRFVRVEDVDRILYTSKSGRTKLIWRRLKEDLGKVVGEASLNSIVNLVTTKVLDLSIVEAKSSLEDV